MNKEKYTQEVNKVLSDHSEDARKRLLKVLSGLPSKVSELNLNIFIDQDGEGFLDVRCSVLGVDPYKWSKKIGKGADIFDTICTEKGFQPPLPQLDIFNKEFNTHEVLTDLAFEWLEKELAKINLDEHDLTVRILSPEGNGTKGPIVIKEHEGKGRTKKSTLIQKLLSRF